MHHGLGLDGIDERRFTTSTDPSSLSAMLQDTPGHEASTLARQYRQPVPSAITPMQRYATMNAVDDPWYPGSSGAMDRMHLTPGSFETVDMRTTAANIATAKIKRSAPLSSSDDGHTNQNVTLPPPPQNTDRIALSRVRRNVRQRKRHNAKSIGETQQ